jgi:hypothetical protein
VVLVNRPPSTCFTQNPDGFRSSYDLLMRPSVSGNLLQRRDEVQRGYVQRGTARFDHKSTSENMHRSFPRRPNIEAAIIAWMVVRRFDMSCEVIIVHDSHIAQAPDFLNRYSTPIKAGQARHVKTHQQFPRLNPKACFPIPMVFPVSR